MELAIRKTNRVTESARRAGLGVLSRLANHVGDVVCVVPDGHPWTATERAQFTIVKVPDLADWHRELLLERTDRPRRIRVRLASTMDGKTVTAATLLAACEDKDGEALPDETTLRQRLLTRLKAAVGG